MRRTTVRTPEMEVEKSGEKKIKQQSPQDKHKLGIWTAKEGAPLLKSLTPLKV